MALEVYNGTRFEGKYSFLTKFFLFSIFFVRFSWNQQIFWNQSKSILLNLPFLDSFLLQNSIHFEFLYFSCHFYSILFFHPKNRHSRASKFQGAGKIDDRGRGGTSEKIEEKKVLSFENRFYLVNICRKYRWACKCLAEVEHFLKTCVNIKAIFLFQFKIIKKKTPLSCNFLIFRLF